MGHNLRVFSTGTEKKGNTGFSGFGPEIGGGKGARIGLIFPQVPTPLFRRFLMRNQVRNLGTLSPTANLAIITTLEERS